MPHAQGVGDLTTTDELVAESARHYKRGCVAKASAVFYRLEWRRNNGIDHDCRTNDDQFRRNMLNDNQFTSKGWTLLAGVVAEVGANTLGLMLKEFHSIDQLHNMVANLRKISNQTKKKKKAA